MQEIIHETQALLEAGEPFALVTVVAEEGSTPRAAGAKMLVRGDGSIAGTVGGGLLEATAMGRAKEALASGQSSLLTMELRGRDIQDGAMLCGGEARLLISFVPGGDAELTQVCSALAAGLEAGHGAVLVTAFGPAADDGGCPVTYSLVTDENVIAGATLDAAEIEALVSSEDPVRNRELSGGRTLHAELVAPRPIVVICGAGHVGHAVAPAAAAVGFDVVVIDDRAEFASRERFPTATRLIVPPDWAQGLVSIELGARSYVVIMTRGHTHDFTVLEQALRTPAAYIGLMASSRKRRRFFETLLERGFTERDLERVHSPVGLPIEAETPAELAVSIVAELIKVRAEQRRA